MWLFNINHAVVLNFGVPLTPGIADADDIFIIVIRNKYVMRVKELKRYSFKHLV